MNTYCGLLWLKPTIKMWLQRKSLESPTSSPFIKINCYIYYKYTRMKISVWHSCEIPKSLETNKGLIHPHSCSNPLSFVTEHLQTLELNSERPQFFRTMFHHDLQQIDTSIIRASYTINSSCCLQPPHKYTHNPVLSQSVILRIYTQKNTPYR